MFKLKSSILISISLLFIVVSASIAHGSLIGEFSSIDWIIKIQLETFVSAPHHDTTSFTLEKKIDIQKSTIHWYPYQRIMYDVLQDGTLEQICEPPGSSVDEFPTLFTRELNFNLFCNFFNTTRLFKVSSVFRDSSRFIFSSPFTSSSCWLSSATNISYHPLRESVRFSAFPR